MAEKTDDIRLRVPKGLKDKYKTVAESRNMSMTQFIIQAVEEKIEREVVSNEWKRTGKANHRQIAGI